MVQTVDKRGNRLYNLDCSFCGEYTKTKLFWEVVEERAEKFCTARCRNDWIEAIEVKNYE